MVAQEAITLAGVALEREYLMPWGAGPRWRIPLECAEVSRRSEFMLSLVLQHHPHNYTDDLKRRTRSAPPRLIREAEHLMRAGDAARTVSRIASQLGLSLRWQPM